MNNIDKDLNKELVTLCSDNDINMHRIFNTRDDTWIFTFWKTGVGSMKVEINSFALTVSPAKIYTDLIGSVRDKFRIK